MSTNRDGKVLALAAAVVLTLTACGGGGGDAEGAAAAAGAAGAEGSETAELEPTRIAIAQLGAMANVDYASDEGYFADEGLDLTVLEVSIATMTAALQSGEAEIALIQPGTGMVANEQGLDLVCIWQNETAGTEAPASNAIMVATGSDIDSVADLAGTRMGVSSIHGQSYAALATVLEDAGVPIEDMQLVETPYDTVGPMLSSGQLDAGITLDPYTTQIQQEGIGEPISYYVIEAVQDQPVGAFWATREWVESHPGEVEAFQAAMARSTDALNEDPELGRQVVADFSGLPIDLVEAMPPIQWNYRVDEAVWQDVVDMMTAAGEISEGHDASEYLSDEVLEYSS